MKHEELQAYTTEAEKAQIRAILKDSSLWARVSCK
jgi:hypothetical protein